MLIHYNKSIIAGDHSFLATIGFIAPDKILIISRRTGSIIWIIRIIRKPHHTIYKQKALSCGSRKRVGIKRNTVKTQCLCWFAASEKV